MLPVINLRGYLDHGWSFKRRIIHHHNDQVATIDGSVSWQKMPGSDADRTLLYREQGVIRLANYIGNASQTYRYDFSSEGIADIYFNDGRFFYTLDLTTSHCDVQHLCGADTYDGTFDAISDHEHHQIWRVTGPRKDYTSHTIFTRS